MTDQIRQDALEALERFDDPLAKPGAGVPYSVRVPGEVRVALRELARQGKNPAALLRAKIAEILAEAPGNGRA